MNDDGTMSRRAEIEVFAQQHNLKTGTIADLIRYRLRNERSIERVVGAVGADGLRRVPHVHVRRSCAQGNAQRIRARPPRRPRAAAGPRSRGRHAARLARLCAASRTPGRSGLQWSALPRPVPVSQSFFRTRKRRVRLPTAAWARAAGLAHVRRWRADPQGSRCLSDACAVGGQRLMHGISAFGLEIAGYVGEESRAKRRSFRVSALAARRRVVVIVSRSSTSSLSPDW